MIYKKRSSGTCTFDYYCLQKELCIVCNKKSHHNEELAKKEPNKYTYHRDSAFEKSEFMKF